MVAAAMVDEARALLERAQAAGVTLRLIGGVAVRWLLAARAPQAAVPRRTPPRDIDLVGLRRQTKAIAAFLSDVGFEENRAYRLNGGGAMMQFGLCTPTLPASDVLLAKLLRADLAPDDVDDALALVRHVPLRARGAKTMSVPPTPA